MNIKILLAYDGTRYFGWQKTRSGPSIEEALKQALETLLQEEIQLEAASRTDKGVHAQGQVVRFSTSKKVDLRKLQKGLQGTLPRDISPLSLESVSETFHPTLDAVGKEYHYQICNSPFQLPFFRHISWHYPHPLSLENMQKAAANLLGEHDFSAFCNERALFSRSTVCYIDEISILPLENKRILIKIIGDHFLYKMVRNLAGALIYAGSEKLDPENFASILESRDRKKAGVTAPAHGLVLKEIFYPPFFFEKKVNYSP